MAVTSDDVKIYFSTTFGAAKTIESITNASPAVATSTAHGFVDGDELLYLDGWAEAIRSIYRADQLSADTVALTDLDSSSTQHFTAGGGVGTLQKVTNWIEVPEVISADSSGDEQQFTTLSTITNRRDRDLPGKITAGRVNMSWVFNKAGADYQAALSATRTNTLAAFKVVFSDGSAMYAYGYISAGRAPKMQSGQALSVPVVFAVQGPFTNYA